MNMRVYKISAIVLGIGVTFLVCLNSGARLRQGSPRGKSDGAFPVRVTELAAPVAAPHHTGPLAFSPDGKSLALPRFREGRVEVWSLVTAKARVLENTSHTPRIRAVDAVFAKGGQSLAVAYEQPEEIVVWDLATETEKARMPVPPGCWTGGMAFADGDRTLVTVMQSAGRYASIIWSPERKTPGNTSVPEKPADPLRLPPPRQPARQQTVLPPTWSVAVVRWEVATGKRQGGANIPTTPQIPGPLARRQACRPRRQRGAYPVRDCHRQAKLRPRDPGRLRFFGRRLPIGRV